MRLAVKYVFLLLFFWGTALVLYSQTVHAKFVFDFINLAFEYKNSGFAGIGNFSSGLSPYWLIKLIFFALLKLIGFNEYAWFLLSCFLHALNAWLLFLLVRLMLKNFVESNRFLIPFFSALLFLLSPYHTEAIVWGGAFNYLVVSSFVLLHLYAVVACISFQNRAWLFVSAFSFFCAIFIHEWGLFLLPADVLLFFLYKSSFQKITTGTKLVLIFIPVAFTLLYFLNQKWQGSLIGHYGAQTHLNFKLTELVPAFYKYLFKLILLFTFFPLAMQDKLYALLQQPVILYLSTGLLLFILLPLLILGYKRKRALQPVVFFFLLFCLFVFPVLNLYFPYWIPIHADRYCYLTSAFLYTAVVILIFQIRGWFKFVLITVFFAVSVWLLIVTNGSWQVAGELQQKLESNFNRWGSQRVFILNVPDTYRGAYMYRNLQTSAFKGAFIKYSYQLPQTEVVEILNYNLLEPYDSVTIDKIDSNRLKVTLSNPGSWWWRNTLGAVSYENETVKVDIDEYNHSYIVWFKQKREDDIILYEANGNWRDWQGW